MRSKLPKPNLRSLPPEVRAYDGQQLVEYIIERCEEADREPCKRGFLRAYKLALSAYELAEKKELAKSDLGPALKATQTTFFYGLVQRRWLRCGR